MHLTLPLMALLAAGFGVLPQARAATTETLETSSLRFTLWPEEGRYEVLDKRAGVTWQSNPQVARFAEGTFRVADKPQRLPLGRCEARRADGGLALTFRPVPDAPDATLRVRVRPAVEGQALEFACDADPALNLETLRLLDQALWTTDAGYAVVPVREGLLVPADSGLAFTHTFDTFAYEGCHMEMVGLVRSNAAALVTWHDPYVALELKSVLTNRLGARQVLLPSLSLRKSARSFRVHFLGSGDYVAIARAYRPVAREKGWLVTWDEKLKGHPDRAKYFGAINFKLWSTLSRRMNEDSSREESVRVNWTFDEAAQIAEHLKRDLRLDRVLFIMGGWIHRGYDNQHPDILPAAPECGGDAAFSNACRRVRALGYVLSLHDNYQDIYRDSPSWSEDCIMKTADGKLHAGGHWAGGRCYLTCSQKALELARRPQNLPAVKRLSDADSYFIDTTYAAGLYECFDQKHPLARWDDLKWKQAISDYAREVFGSFGSECGREWAIPHAEFFEGFTGVSGTYYHNKDLPRQLGATPVPLFEMVYRDCIQMYGKYGYDAAQAAEYVLHHIALGRPLHYHSVPSHLYWKNPVPTEARALALRPGVAEVKQTGPRQFSIRYQWAVEKPVEGDWRVFVHFTDNAGNIRFQDDHEPRPPVAQWRPGTVSQGPFTVAVPEGLSGAYNVRLGLFKDLSGGGRARLLGQDDGQHRYLAGKLKVTGDKVEFEPAPQGPGSVAGDPGVFVRADNGWAEGLHPLDRFVKNTAEILSPLNELTSRVLLTRHQFLTPDRKVQRSVFGEGAEAMVVVVNGSSKEYRHRSDFGGEVLLPPFGFVVESPTFAAFHALSWNGLRYEAPVLFSLRSLDGRPLERSGRVRVFHGFGDARLKLGKAERTIPREEVVSATER